MEAEGLAEILAQDDGTHLGDRGLGDAAFGKLRGPQIDGAELGEHRCGSLAADGKPAMRVCPRHGVADRLARTGAAPVPGRVQIGDETAGASQ